MQIGYQEKGENAICPVIKKFQAPSCHGIYRIFLNLIHTGI